MSSSPAALAVDDARRLEGRQAVPPGLLVDLPGLWRHGDYAIADDAGWFILGRSDDVMNVAGERVAPAEIESVLATDAAVAESAVVGIPDATKGEAVWAFWVRRAGAADTDGDEDDGMVSARLTALVAAQVGKPFAPARVVRVAQLPKTGRPRSCAGRSARPCSTPSRRSVRAENPEAVEDIRSQVKELR